jgi:endonuclease/exonuclease/phosphatase family metal-dependent hydrolase
MPNHYIAFWNLENLFDIENSPRRTEKLTRTVGKELAGWTQAVLDQKIAQLVSIIRQMNAGQGPDLLGVCEVENRHVLELLAAALAPLGRNYDIAHADTQDQRGIDVAFLYDADRFTNEAQFSHSIVKRSATRDIVQVNFRTAAGRLLVVVGNHWPSRMGGELASEPYRIIAAETLAYFHERIAQVHGVNTPVLAMGDFNDEPHNRSLVDYALCERNRTKVMNARTQRFLNLMWPMLGDGLGSHYFENTPNLLDQILVSKPLLKASSPLRVQIETVEIVRFPEMIGRGDYPAPIRFGRGNSINRNGFSDHFPIGVMLHES